MCDIGKTVRTVRRPLPVPRKATSPDDQPIEAPGWPKPQPVGEPVPAPNWPVKVPDPVPLFPHQ